MGAALCLCRCLILSCLPGCPRVLKGVMRMWSICLLVLCQLRTPVQLAAVKPPAERPPGRRLQVAVLLPGPPQDLAALLLCEDAYEGKSIPSPGCTHRAPHTPPSSSLLCLHLRQCPCSCEAFASCLYVWSHCWAQPPSLIPPPAQHLAFPGRLPGRFSGSEPLSLME